MIAITSTADLVEIIVAILDIVLSFALVVLSTLLSIDFSAAAAAAAADVVVLVLVFVAYMLLGAFPRPSLVAQAIDVLEMLFDWHTSFCFQTEPGQKMATLVSVDFQPKWDS